jgi:3-hydroxyacyl-[acyl-carrier-protein] dehydratase
MPKAAYLCDPMLLKNFYTILDRSVPEEEISPSGVHSNRYRFTLALNPTHPVYEGHFSGNPVVPGVCQVQMISELVSLIKGFPVFLKNADNVKFLSLMVPDKNPTIEAMIQVKEADNDLISVTATLQEKDVIFIKFKGLFRNET